MSGAGSSSFLPHLALDNVSILTSVSESGITSAPLRVKITSAASSTACHQGSIVPFTSFTNTSL